MSLEGATEPTGPEVAETPEADDVDDVEADGEDELDVEEDGSEESQEDDGDGPIDLSEVDVEFEGKTYKVAPELKDALMMRADYTRKTQEIAEQRKAFEAQAESRQETAKIEAELGDSVMELRAMHKELEQFTQLDWVALQNEDPNLAQQMTIRFNMLNVQKDGLEKQLAEKQGELTAKLNRDRDNHIEQQRTQLTANIPDWNDAKEAEVASFAKSIGFEEKAIRSAIGNDWKIAKVLNLAHLGQQVLNQRQKPKKQRPVESQQSPLPELKGKTTPNRGPNNRQSVDDWMKARNRQLKKA